MATFGRTTFTGVTFTNWFGFLAATIQAAPATDGTVTSIFAYCDNATNARVALYSDSGGNPDVRQGESGSEACIASAWHEFSGFNIPVSAGINYWFAWQQDANTPVLDYVDAGPTASRYIGQAYGAFPLNFPVHNNYAREHSQYALYTETGGAPSSAQVLTCLWKTAMAKAPKASLKHFPLHV